MVVNNRTRDRSGSNRHQKLLKNIFFVSTNKSISLVASKISSTYKTKNKYLLPLAFIYMHSSKMFSLKPLAVTTSSNSRYHYLEACFRLYMDF